jgi:coatomer subunit beta
MDILRVLSSPDMDVRKKALGIAMDMASGRNVEELVLFLKKELIKTLDSSVDKVSLRAITARPHEKGRES